MKKQDTLIQLEYYLEQVETIQKEIAAKDDKVQIAIKQGINGSNYSLAMKLQQETEQMLQQSTINIKQKIQLFSRHVFRLSSHQQRQQLMQRCIDGSNRAEKQMQSLLNNMQTLSDAIFEQKKKIQTRERSLISVSQTSNQSSDFFKSDIEGSGGDQQDIQANMEVIDYEQEMIKQRQEEIDKIQNLVITLNQTMNQMLEMIKEQGKNLNLIEENLNAVSVQIKGMNQTSISSNEYQDQLSEPLINKNKELESNRSDTEITGISQKKSKRCWYIVIFILIVIGVAIGLFFGLRS